MCNEGSYLFLDVDKIFLSFYQITRDDTVTSAHPDGEINTEGNLPENNQNNRISVVVGRICSGIKLCILDR